ncbi:protein FAM161A [Agrilus planipennis]|uniref:Protein FAM161A n=1 Tax=Agrilus planipennis TaxID=224129 RepID=A0A1W4WQQ1_AGRPL|nr:protein FAM161A [Agrilus planipennis]
MSEHRVATYNTSCLNVPRHPLNQHPFPIYEQEYFENLDQPRKYALDIKNMDTKIRSSYSPDSQKIVLKSLLEFYDSIPEYDDVNHLPNNEFYKKLDNLREKQRLFYKYMQNGIKFENKKTEWTNDYKDMTIGNVKPQSSRPKSSLKPFCVTPTPTKKFSLKNSDIESLSSMEKEHSRRTVKIDEIVHKKEDDFDEFITPKGRSSNVSCTRYKSKMDHYWDDLSIHEYKSDSERDLFTSRSAPNSPVRNKCPMGWKSNGITIPKPFQMTVNDEETQIINEILEKEKPKPKSDDKQQMFKAHPIPIESRIPLFDKIMAEQERRRERVKSKSRQSLLAQMKPFSFTRREEQVREMGKCLLSQSSPSIFLSDKPKKRKPFRAKPVPKNLFSNYIYKKMNEDEFYRCLQKKIRAEEMLKASSLPPSMAKREKTRLKHEICPKTLKSVNALKDSDICRRCLHFIPHHKKECLEKELEQLAQEYMESNTKTVKKKKKKSSRPSTVSSRITSAQSFSSSSLRPKSAADLQPVNYSNLAAVLRIQSAKRRMEEEMVRRLEEAKLRDEIRWREKVLRKKPVWQNLAFNTEGDLAMRLQLRKDEERMRNEEHRHRMELMYGRVNDMPTLFERQSQFTKDAKPKQHCLAKYEKNFTRKLENRCNSQLSDLFTKTTKRKMIDEAVEVKEDYLFNLNNNCKENTKKSGSSNEEVEEDEDDNKEGNDDIKTQ